MTPFPCIMIGGGLAGAACAIELARNGRRVTVLERTRTAQHKVCGEFLSAEAQAMISYLGVDVWKLGATAISLLHLSCGAELPILDLPFPAAGLSRQRLDEALLQRAAEVGAQIMRGHHVARIEPAGDAIVVHTHDREFRAACAALATGKHDVRGCARPRGSMVAFKLQLHVGAAAAAALRNLVHLSIFPGGYGGACLVEGGAATLCWAIEQGLLAEIGSAWPAHVRHLSSQSVFLGDLLAGGRALWEKPVATAGIPYGFLRRRPIDRLVFPVGDQIAVIPSYTGDGMSIALHSGIAAARAILDGRTAAEFHRTMISGLAAQMRWAAAGNLLLSTPTMQRLTATLARAVPWAAPRLVAFLADATRVRGVERLTGGRA